VGLSPATSATPVNCCHRRKPSTLFRLPCETGRKVGTTSSQYGPYGLGCTRTTMPSTERSETARWRKSIKTGPSSDWSLQLDSMKPESLVMPYQLRRREYVPGPCTHRPSHHGSRPLPNCIRDLLRSPKERVVTGVKY